MSNTIIPTETCQRLLAHSAKLGGIADHLREKGLEHTAMQINEISNELLQIGTKAIDAESQIEHIDLIA